MFESLRRLSRDYQGIRASRTLFAGALCLGQVKHAVNTSTVHATEPLLDPRSGYAPPL